MNKDIKTYKDICITSSAISIIYPVGIRKFAV